MNAFKCRYYKGLKIIPLGVTRVEITRAYLYIYNIIYVCICISLIIYIYLYIIITIYIIYI
ncbi:hypothetical protein CNEO4_800003 [Clostridium neonatale]|nr:hypothetical protein CNEO4_800003 [Clostridium neonatale]